MGRSVGPFTDALAVADHGDVHIVLYRGRLSARELEIAHAHHLALQQRMPEGTLSLSVAEPGLPAPAADARRILPRLAREAAERTRASAVVIPGRGLWLAVARRALSSALRLGASTPLHFSENDERALRWLQRWSSGETPTVSSLVESLAVLRDAALRSEDYFSGR